MLLSPLLTLLQADRLHISAAAGLGHALDAQGGALHEGHLCCSSAYKSRFSLITPEVHWASESLRSYVHTSMNTKDAVEDGIT